MGKTENDQFLDENLKKFIKIVKAWDPKSEVLVLKDLEKTAKRKVKYTLTIISEQFEGLPPDKRNYQIAKLLYRSGSLGDFDIKCYTNREYQGIKEKET